MSTHSTNSVPLNVFQRLARDWERVHPYNAAQALKISGTLDFPAIERTWSDALNTARLGRVHVNGRTFRHEMLNGELIRYPVRLLPVGTDLGAFFTEELNRPFADPAEPPYRPFVLPAADGKGYHLGVVYQHWVADSVAIRLLLREWFVRLFDPDKLRKRPFRHATDGYWNMFGPKRARWSAGDTLLALLRRHLRYRRSRKVQTFGPLDYPVHVTLREAPEGLIERLHAYARTKNAKVNDVFLAALAESCQTFVPTQKRHNRQDLAVASIVDLRPHASDDLSETFGLFLGFTEVVCGANHLRDFSRLVQCVAGQNRQHRHKGIPESSLGWLMAALAAKRFVPPEKMYHFYRKETPLAGGVSNVNLNNTWAARYHPGSLEEYVRVSPTGPMVPLVFTLTTLGKRLHLSTTYRPVLVDDATANAMATAFMDRLILVSSQ